MPKQYLEWDIDNPKHRQRRPRQPPPLDGEVLEPEPRIRVEVVHRHQPPRRSIAPQMVTIAALVVLVLILFRSPGALILLAVLLTAQPMLAVAIGGTIAVLIVAALWEWRHGRPF
jgi:hypothetical protein